MRRRETLFVQCKNANIGGPTEFASILMLYQVEEAHEACRTFYSIFMS